MSLTFFETSMHVRGFRQDSHTSNCLGDEPFLFCTKTNTTSILLLISERVNVWEKNNNSNYAENPDKLKGTLGNLHGW